MSPTVIKLVIYLFRYTILLVFSAAFSFQGLSQTNAISGATRQRILATYQLVKDSLLPLAPSTFMVRNTAYSVPIFEEIHKQIARGNLPQARTYLRQAISSNELATNPLLYITAKCVWIDYLISTDSLEKAYEEGVSLIRKADSLKASTIPQAYVATGRAGCTLEQYYSYSAMCATKALSIARQNGDKVLEAQARLIIGVLARGLFWGSSGRPIPHYDAAIAAATTGKDTVTLIRALYLKNADLAPSGNIEQGLPGLEQAAHLVITSRSLLWVPRICLGLTIELNAIGETDKSIELLLAALTRTKQYGTRQMELHLYIQLSELYVDHQQYDSALYYLNQWKYTDPFDPGRKALLLTKANLYARMGRYKEATTLYEENNREHENAYMLHGQNVLSQWEATLRMQDKELEIEHNKTRRKQLIWISSGISVLLAVTLLALLWQRSLRRRVAAQNRLISRQSEKLQHSLAEKEMLLKEIHHRVKNNLQVIDGLLDMHQEGLPQPGQAEEAFNKARAQVHTIAMVHQNLYQQQDVSTVNLQPFVNNLFAQTEQLFNRHHKACVLNNQVNAVQLDIDTAIPLGLILNELLTNAFKYVLPVVAELQVTIGISAGMQPEAYVLHCQDNGPGLPDGTLPVQSSSLGLQLVKQLSRQIGGRVSYHFNEGSHFTITFLTLKGRKAMD